MRSVILMAALFAGCNVESGEEECDICQEVEVCEDECEPVLEQVGTQLVCELQTLELTDTVCSDTEECLIRSVCDTEILCDTTEFSYVDTSCIDYEANYSDSYCEEVKYSYTELECEEEGAVEEEPQCLFDGDNECPEWIPDSDGNYYYWCFEFSDGWSDCGLSNGANADIHGMEIHISCSAEYDEEGYPDKGEPVQANGDPSVVDYSVSKYKVRHGDCEFKKSCGNTEFEHEEEVCEETEVTESFDVCIDYDYVCDETTCSDTEVTEVLEVCIEDEDCRDESTVMQGVTCEEVTFSQEVEVCVEVPVYDAVLECEEVCKTAEVCDESNCDPDNEWFSGGGALGN
jgi:hypothetical protein